MPRDAEFADSLHLEAMTSTGLPYTYMAPDFCRYAAFAAILAFVGLPKTQPMCTMSSTLVYAADFAEAIRDGIRTATTPSKPYE